MIGWGIGPLVAGTCSDIMWADEGSLIVGEVQAATGFPLEKGPLTPTPLPDAEALAIIAQLDPHNIRASVIKDNPPAIRAN